MSEKKDEVLDPADPGTANNEERELIEKLTEARLIADGYKEQYTQANKEAEAIEHKLLALLEADGKAATARYEGLGHATAVSGAAQASIEKGRQPEVIEYLRAEGRDDLIKTRVESASLSTYVRQCLQENKELPPGVTFYKPKWINLYPPKN